MTDLTQAMSSRQSATLPACAGTPTSVMFPSLNGRPNKRDPLKHYRPALDLCARCDSHDDCRQRWEDAGRPDIGVWFGTTPDQRHHMRPARPQLAMETLTWLMGNGPATAQDIYEGLGGINGGVNAVYSVLRRLRVSGHIVANDTRPATYTARGI